MQQGSSPERLYLEYVPQLADLRHLTRLQMVLVSPAGHLDVRPVPSSELHLTLLHVGVFDAVLADLRRWRPGLTGEALARALDDFTSAAGPLLPPTATFITESLELLGNGSVLAAIGRVDEDLRAAHAACLPLLQAALRQCLEGDDPVPFMQDSTNFRHALQLKPHITLLRGRAARRLGHGPLTLPPPLQLRVLPLRHDLKQRRPQPKPPQHTN